MAGPSVTAPATRSELRTDYEATQGVWSQLVETRFRLLALAPIATALGVTHDSSPAVPALGILVTVGIVLYEIRNSQLHDNAVHRMQWLERQLGISSSVSDTASGGPQTDIRGSRPLRLAGGFRVVHDRSLALVYGAVAAAWAWSLVSTTTQQWWSGWAVTLPANGVGAVAALTTVLTILRASHRSRASVPLDLGAEPIDESAPPETIGIRINQAVDVAARNKRSRLDAGLVEAARLGLVENRRAITLKRRVDPADEWWTGTDPIENGRIRRGLVPRRERRVVHLRPSAKVRSRPTPWGDLWRARPVEPRAAERRADRLLRHLSERVEGLGPVLDVLKDASERWMTRSELLAARVAPDREVDGFLSLLRSAGLLAWQVSQGKQDVFQLARYQSGPVGPTPGRERSHQQADESMTGDDRSAVREDGPTAKDGDQSGGDGGPTTRGGDQPSGGAGSAEGGLDPMAMPGVPPEQVPPAPATARRDPGGVPPAQAAALPPEPGAAAAASTAARDPTGAAPGHRPPADPGPSTTPAPGIPELQAAARALSARPGAAAAPVSEMPEVTPIAAAPGASSSRAPGMSEPDAWVPVNRVVSPDNRFADPWGWQHPAPQ